MYRQNASSKETCFTSRSAISEHENNWRKKTIARLPSTLLQSMKSFSSYLKTKTDNRSSNLFQMTSGFSLKGRLLLEECFFFREPSLTRMLFGMFSNSPSLRTIPETEHILSFVMLMCGPRVRVFTVPGRGFDCYVFFF